MARDIKMTWDNDLMQADVSLLYGDLETDEGLETAILMSLFTDRRAEVDEVDENELDRKGWWADQYSDIENDQIGSKLWLLKRSTTTDETITKCKEYILEATQWMLDDEVASNIEVEVERQGDPGNDRLAFFLKIYKDWEGSEATEFNVLWDSQFGLIGVLE